MQASTRLPLVRAVAHFAGLNTVRDFDDAAEARRWIRERMDAGCAVAIMADDGTVAWVREAD